jgi:glycosyltransferase involved in cell wall biosynthesis
MFVGTPRPHKGLFDLVRAFRSVRAPGAELCIIGAAQERELGALAAADERVRIEPGVSLDALPDRLARAWLVVIPQRDHAASRAQLPAKLIDAMALGKAILSTSVGDLPRWLEPDCGVLVPPDDVPSLARAMDELLGDPTRLARLGANARARFLEQASERVVRPRLCALVDGLLSTGAALQAAEGLRDGR